MSYHPFHLVERSPWPITSAFSVMYLTYGITQMITTKMYTMFLMGLLLMLMSAYQWWRDIVREATYQGHHTSYVTNGLKISMLLFITSEVMFFFAFFWAFFHSALSPDINIGSIWPPKGIMPFNPYQIPLLNTTILLISGLTITWSHHSILNKNFNNALLSLIMTSILGIYFSILQMFEYMMAPFTIMDNIFGSVFFMATGFHGFHVMIGTTFIIINIFRMQKKHFSNTHHFSFEACAWYWHFVDVVWLYLYSFMYWWTY